jgi:hypothetical protein
MQRCNSNLTFGAGGKDKDGLNVEGWGYYEVRLVTRLSILPFPYPLAYPYRPSPAAPALAPLGMVPLACTPTSPTPASGTSRSWNDAILSYSTGLD